MKHVSSVSVVVGAVAVAGALVVSGSMATLSAQGAGAAAGAAAQAAPAAPAVPTYRVNPLWPLPLPNHRVWGSITGVAVDPQDHIWVVHRGGDSLEANEKGQMLSPPTSSVCCTAAPFVGESDQNGRVGASVGGPGQGDNWPQSPGGITVDNTGHVWVTAAGLVPPPPGGTGAPPAPTTDAHVIKFTKSGTFVLQIGKPGQATGDDALSRPSAVAVDTAANEVFIADTGNRRIAVFDSETGKFKRAWGAYGERPGADPGAYDPNAAPSRQFRDVTCVEIAKDGMVYVCDRTSNRIQVFQKDGKFVKEAVVDKNTRGSVVTGQFGVVSSFGSAWDIAFSSDAQQRYLFVADGQDKNVRILQRDTLRQVGTIGQGGRQPGRFLAVGSIAVDSRGNVYTGEQHHGKRVQKFAPVTAARQ